MEGLFGEAAARLSSAASLLLGWHPEDFWRATPAELALAMSLAAAAVDAPDTKTIQSLRLRFPDEGTG